MNLKRCHSKLHVFADAKSVVVYPQSALLRTMAIIWGPDDKQEEMN